MTLAAGFRLGTYEILAAIGAGGMGEVYRARDMKLGRDVALKILPELFAADGDRLARFQREAQVLASLNHPNIAAIYGLEDADGVRALVLELVEGPTLADRVAKGPIAVEDALPIARQVADALEAAHEKGVIHRDLKPANIKVRPDGTVKVLDFGLAKAMQADPSGGLAAASALTQSPTLSLMATQAGMILGTAAYMSPEQAQGLPVDHRSDVFSFGAVLFEMLTGRQAFQGETAAAILASVLVREPDLTTLPPNLNPRLADLLRRCLDKHPTKRWQAVGDLRAEVEAVAAAPRAVPAVGPKPLWRRAIPGAIGVLVGGVVVAATVAVMNSRPSPPAVVVRFPFVLPEDQRFSNATRSVIAMSPDGASIVYVANRQLYLRRMGDMEARPIQGASQDASEPFFSPDGRWVAYYSRADRTLKKISIAGGAAVTVCETDDRLGPTWNADGNIYFGQQKGVVRVSANGGKLEKVIALKDDEVAHRPQLLPDGEHVLFTLAGATAPANRWDTAQIVVQSLKSGERKVLISGGSDGQYALTGHLTYAQGSTVLGVPFDVQKLQTGDPVPIVEGVRRAGPGGASGADAQFAFSNNGSMVYIPGGQITVNDLGLVLVDRSGARKPLNVPPGPYTSPRISPTGKQLAVETNDGKDRIVWIYDLNDTAQLRKLTFEGHNAGPLWTRDGQRVVFASDREGGWGLFWQRVDGGSAERLAKLEEQSIRPQTESWSPDGKVLIFTNRKIDGVGNAGNEGISMLSIAADQKPKVVIKSDATNASLSPDGRWLAYAGTGSARSEVFVQPFPPTGEKHQITTDRGDNPLWSPDGKQLFFLGGAGGSRQIMAVDVQTERGFAFGKATPLPIGGILNPGPRPYDIMPDAKSFVVIVPKLQAVPDKAPPEQIIVTLNWQEELKQRVPSK